jgi:hypothetical protein
MGGGGNAIAKPGHLDAGNARPRDACHAPPVKGGYVSEIHLVRHRLPCSSHKMINADRIAESA